MQMTGEVNIAGGSAQTHLELIGEQTAYGTRTRGVTPAPMACIREGMRQNGSQLHLQAHTLPLPETRLHSNNTTIQQLTEGCHLAAQCGHSGPQGWETLPAI